MSKPNHKSSLTTYRIVRQSELTAEQLQILRAASRRMILERLAALIGGGAVSVSQVQARYGALMSEVARDT
jgi:hypothetical protein